MVHDSDIACYWLFDKGQLLDEYNSCPDYFGGGEEGPSGGKTDILIRYCRDDVRREDLDGILQDDPTFAESIVEQLADALGIDPGRALSDFRDDGGDDGP